MPAGRAGGRGRGAEDVSVSIQRSRKGLRAAGAAGRNPRPDGVSRRVAAAAHPRRPRTLQSAVPTGWHRRTFEDPGYQEPGGHQYQVGRFIDIEPARDRRMPRAAVVAGLLVATGAAGAAVAIILAAPSEPDPGPVPHPSIGVTASPTPTNQVLPEQTSVLASVGPTPSVAPSVAPTVAPTVAQTDSAAPAAPAVVSPLTAGDPGFGWPSTAFGSVPVRG